MALLIRRAGGGNGRLNLSMFGLLCTCSTSVHQCTSEPVHQCDSSAISVQLKTVELGTLKRLSAAKRRNTTSSVFSCFVL